MPKYFRIFKDDAYSRHTGQPRQNLTPYEQLEKYKDNPDVYISFRSIEKIGINPKSKYDTPNGIYTYPLKEIWKEFDHSQKKIVVPFAGKEPYIYVIESVGIGIKDLSKYSESDLENDIEKLKDGINDDEINDLFIESSQKSKIKIPGGRLWYITYKLSQLLTGKPANTWNLILNKTLGYNYVCDLKGEGIIHPYEPIQAVFFNTKCFKTLDVIDNKVKIQPPDWVIESGNKPKKFSYSKGGNFIWEDGIWKNGSWYGGIWKNGVWEDGDWHEGTWEDGIWKNGSWRGGWIYDKDQIGNSKPDWKWDEKFVRSPISPEEYFKGK